MAARKTVPIRVNDRLPQSVQCCVDSTILKVVGQVAGVAGIALGVFLLLFRDVIRKQIFPELTKQQAYRLLTLVLILVWSIAVCGIVAWVWGSLAGGSDELKPNAVTSPPSSVFTVIDALTNDPIYREFTLVYSLKESAQTVREQAVTRDQRGQVTIDGTRDQILIKGVGIDGYTFSDQDQQQIDAGIITLDRKPDGSYQDSIMPEPEEPSLAKYRMGIEGQERERDQCGIQDPEITGAPGSRARRLRGRKLAEPPIVLRSVSRSLFGDAERDYPARCSGT
jgi:hypothetical protein